MADFSRVSKELRPIKNQSSHALLYTRLSSFYSDIIKMNHNWKKYNSVSTYYVTTSPEKMLSQVVLDNNDLPPIPVYYSVGVVCC